MNTLDTFLFGLYPYICLSIFLLGSLIRFDREQYTWKTDSSQLLRHGQLRWASNLFHIGVLGIFGGHLTGFLTPVAIWHALGVSLPEKQMTAMVAGGVFGTMCLIGLAMLLTRRLSDPRIRASAQGLFMLMTNGIGAVLGSLVAGFVIDHWFTAPGGAKDWHGIWVTFALYSLAMAVLFVPLFRHRHDRGAVVPAHGAADVGNP